VGNHDWDMGLDNFRQLAATCKFPWLLSNVLDKGTSELRIQVAPGAGQCVLLLQFMTTHKQSAVASEPFTRLPIGSQQQ
jgi:hypothetical protein